MICTCFKAIDHLVKEGVLLCKAYFQCVILVAAIVLNCLRAIRIKYQLA